MLNKYVALFMYVRSNVFFCCRVLFHHEGGISQDKNVKKVCEDLYSSGNRSPFLLAFLVDICEENIQRRDGDEAYSLDHAIEVLSHSVKDFICRVILCLWNN